MCTDNEAMGFGVLCGVVALIVGLLVGSEINQIKHDREEANTLTYYNKKLQQCNDVITRARNAIQN